MEKTGTTKITSGKYRGRKILTPGGNTHPMGSREKLALFNMLGGKIKGALVLDAFAGSGALGIEALSLGAEEVVFIEKSAAASDIIKKNLKTLGIGDEAKIIQKTVSHIAPELAQFDVILADPPYDKFDLSEVLSLMPLLKDEGIMILSHPDTPPVLPGLILEKTRQYASAHISFYQK